MKLKSLSLVVVLVFISSIFSFSQGIKKQEFIYKSIRGHDIKANIFIPSSKEKLPVLVYFHGGGFIFGNRDQGLDTILKEKLLANNYAVVSADYRLAPETKLEEIIKDVSDVIKWLKVNGEKKYNIDTKKIAAAGGSSGGYLALSTGFNSKEAPNAIVAISTPTGFSPGNIQMGDLSVLKQPGPYDIVKDPIVSYGDYDLRMTLWRFLAKNRLALYEIFGFDPSKDIQRLEKFQLPANIDSDYPPTLLIHAKNDLLVDLGQVEEFYSFLKKKNVVSELYLVENGHNSELINQYPEATDKLIEFLNVHLK